MSAKIKFVGSDSQFITGVPKRDMTDAEFKALPEDLQKAAYSTGLYVDDSSQPKEQKQSEVSK